MLIKRLEELAYEVADCCEEANMCLDDISERWNRDEEVAEGFINLCQSDLKEAMQKAKIIEMTLANVNEYLNTIDDSLNLDKYLEKAVEGVFK